MASASKQTHRTRASGPDAAGFFPAYGNRRSPVKSASPAAEDFDAVVSVLAERPLPSLLSNSPMEADESACVFNSPTDLMEPELLFGLKTPKKVSMVKGPA